MTYHTLYDKQGKLDEYGGKCQEGKTMNEEVMTDFQFKSLLKMVLTILEDCNTVDEAKEKIETLLNE